MVRSGLCCRVTARGHGEGGPRQVKRCLGNRKAKTHHGLISDGHPLRWTAPSRDSDGPGALERWGTHLRLIPHSLILFSNVL